MGKSFDATKRVKDRSDGIKFSSEKKKGVNKNIQKDFVKTFKSSADIENVDDEEFEAMFEDDE